MILYTTSLLLRDVSFHDLEAIHQLNSLPDTDKYNTLGIPATIAATEQLLTGWLADQQRQPRPSYILSIDTLHTPQLTGLIALIMGKEKFKVAEIWYKIHPAHWGRGYASEAVKAVLGFAFNELKLHRVEAGCATGNIASARVLEKAGMTREGMKRKNLPIRGEWFDAFTFGILEDEFRR